jgi:hypothetical protein
MLGIMEQLRALHFSQLVVGCSAWTSTHGGLDEAPSFRGMRAKTARTRAASQPGFRSDKLREMERPHKGTSSFIDARHLPRLCG